MGILDSLENNPALRSALGQLGAAVLPAVLGEVLGNDTVRQLAARYNIPVDQLGEILAQELPKAVDQASPNGHLPHGA